MRLYRAAGIATEVQATEESRALLAAQAEAFLLAGGVLTLADWQELDVEERRAFITARADLASDEADGAALEAAVEEAVP